MSAQQHDIHYSRLLNARRARAVHAFLRAEAAWLRASRLARDPAAQRVWQHAAAVRLRVRENLLARDGIPQPHNAYRSMTRGDSRCEREHNLMRRLERTLVDYISAPSGSAAEAIASLLHRRTDRMLRAMQEGALR